MCDITSCLSVLPVVGTVTLRLFQTVSMDTFPSSPSLCSVEEGSSGGLSTPNLEQNQILNHDELRGSSFCTFFSSLLLSATSSLLLFSSFLSFGPSLTGGALLVILVPV